MASASHNRSLRILLACGALAAFSGCSIKKYAINKVGDSLAAGGSVYASDDDLELVGEALPFSLKLVESLLAESPRHRGLLRTAAEGFTSYSYIYVHSEADFTAAEDLAEASKLRARARKLYLRAYRYGIRGLELSCSGVGEALGPSPQQAISCLSHKKDVPLLYWTGAALGLAISVSRNDPAMLARLPEVDALLDRAMALEESWDKGALHQFEVTFARARPGAMDFDRMAVHFQRALELSKRTRAGLFVAYAEAVAIPNQDRPLFDRLLEDALAIDVDAHEENRLANTVAQRRARWLLLRADELILPIRPAGSTSKKGEIQ